MKTLNNNQTVIISGICKGMNIVQCLIQPNSIGCDISNVNGIIDNVPAMLKGSNVNFSINLNDKLCLFYIK